MAKVFKHICSLDYKYQSFDFFVTSSMSYVLTVICIPVVYVMYKRNDVKMISLLKVSKPQNDFLVPSIFQNNNAKI